MKHGSASRRFQDDVLRLLAEALGHHGFVERDSTDPYDDIVIRDARGTIVRLQAKSVDEVQSVPAKTTSSSAPLFVLRRATRRLHGELRQAGHNFVDLSGTVHLMLPTMLVDRTNLRIVPKGRLVRQSFDPFSDRSSLIARTLLKPEHRNRSWGVREMAGAAGVSPATATRVIRELERHGVQMIRRGRSAEVRLSDSQALFGAWTRAYDWVRNSSLAFNAPVGDAARFLTRTAKAWSGPRWALTLHAGASRIAPISTWDRIHIYVDVPDASGLEPTGEEQGWEPAEQGNVVLMKPYYKTSVWHDVKVLGGIPVVSPLQLALDLWHYPLRGREQAEHLLGAVAEIHL
jgi:hypothetical protein